MERHPNWPYPHGDDWKSHAVDVHNALVEESRSRVRDFDFITLNSMPWIDVREYGAVGDGTTDDASAIQATVDALGSHGMVYFPQGTYVVDSSITITKSDTGDSALTQPDVLSIGKGLKKTACGYALFFLVKGQQKFPIYDLLFFNSQPEIENYSVSSFCRSSIISAFEGRASIEPNFVQARAPAAEANLTASLTSSFTAQ